jgi:hypothetical protein
MCSLGGAGGGSSSRIMINVPSWNLLLSGFRHIINFCVTLPMPPPNKKERKKRMERWE